MSPSRIGSRLIATAGFLIAAGLATMLPAQPASAATTQGAVITNGTVTLGVNPDGGLDYDCAGNSDPGGCPVASQSGEAVVGLRYAPLNLDAIAPGCDCEGWGFADATSGLTGYVNKDVSTSGGSAHVTVNNFNAPNTQRAISTVTISDPAHPGYSMQVVQDYHPSPLSDNLYVDTVTVTNTGGNALTGLRYRRVMDWDVEPTAFDEWVTIHGTSPELLFDSDNGFAPSNPLAGPSYLFSEDACGDGYAGPCEFDDLGDGDAPGDHGALFDFGFGTLNVGQSRSFNVYYGAAPSESTALSALTAGGAQVYSLGESSCSGGTIATCSGDEGDAGRDLGQPATFIFGFVTTAADIGITQTDAPDPVQAGQNLTYSMTVHNNGPGTATGVHVSDTLPAGVDLVSATPDQGSCTEGATVGCDLGSISPAGDAHVTVVVRPTAAAVGTISNTATASTASGDSNPGNDSATSTTTVNPATAPPADIGMSLSDSPDPVQVGQNLTYSIAVHNSGPNTATGVHVNDALPPGDVVPVSANADQGSCSGGQTVDCSLGSIASGGDAHVTIVVQPTPPAVGTLFNTPSISTTSTDGNVSNDTATASTTVTPASSAVVAELPPPELFDSANAAFVSGKVFIKKPGGGFEELTGEEQIPLGSIIDVTNGVVSITSAKDADGSTETAKFWAGVFKLVQVKGKDENGKDIVLTQLVLVDQSAGASRATTSRKGKKLWGDGKGNYKTKGGYGSATVRGTRWLTKDSAAGTLIKVVRGIVSVRDFGRKKTIKVNAGHKLLVTPPGRPAGKVR